MSGPLRHHCLASPRVTSWMPLSISWTQTQIPNLRKLLWSAVPCLLAVQCSGMAHNSSRLCNIHLCSLGNYSLMSFLVGMMASFTTKLGCTSSCFSGSLRHSRQMLVFKERGMYLQQNKLQYFCTMCAGGCPIGLCRSVFSAVETLS